jgi:hypothetical protein
MTEEKILELRRQAEARMEELRSAVRTEIGRTPRKKGLWFAIVAGAVGLALGARKKLR